MRIQLLSTVRPAKNGPSTSGLPFTQFEYWTFVPSYHFIWLSTAEKKKYHDEINNHTLRNSIYCTVHLLAQA